MQGYRPPKKRKRYKRRGVAYVFLSLVFIVAAVLLSLSLFFKINRIEVTGSAVYSDSAIISASGVSEGDNLFTLDKGAILRNIFDTFPYVAEVRLMRRLPGTLIISITERAPLGLIKQDSACWLIDGTGRLLEQVSSRSITGKPLIQGITLLAPDAGAEAAVPMEQRDRLKALLALLDGLERYELLPVVSAADISQAHELRLTYSTGRFQVLLGDVSNLDIKLPFLLAAIEELPDSASGTLDVSRAALRKKASYIPAPTTWSSETMS